MYLKLPLTTRHRSRYRTINRNGFTLIELLVVVGLILLLATISATVINLTMNRDKVRAAARQVQSYLAGARDRAIYAKAPVGVRFLLDPTNNRTVSSMVYIKQPEVWNSGLVILERLDLNNDGTADDTLSANPPAVVVRGFDNDPAYTWVQPTNWKDLWTRGLLYDGARIQLESVWYTISTELLGQASDPGFLGTYYPPRLRLTAAFERAPTNTDPTKVVAFPSYGANTLNLTSYLLELPPSVFPNADPVILPKGTVVHLDRCTAPAYLEQSSAGAAPNRGDKLPTAWKHYPSLSVPPDPTGFDYTSQMDVMFSPRGTVTGPAAQRGIVHLYIADQKDADRDRLVYWSSGIYPTASAPEYGALADKYERGDKVVLSIFTRTGAVSTHSVYSNADPFKFAETGEVAGK